MKRIIFIAVIGLVLWITGSFLSPGPVQAFPYYNSENHYSLNIPDWAIVPQKNLEEAEALKKYTVYDEYPIEYSLDFMAFDYLDYTNREDITMLTIEFYKAELSESLIKEVFDDLVLSNRGENGPIDPYYSEVSKFFVASAASSENGVIYEYWLHAYFFGNEGYVGITLRCPSDNIRNTLPIFEEMVKSFTFDDGYKYQRHISDGPSFLYLLMFFLILIIVMFAIIILSRQTVKVPNPKTNESNNDIGS
jgi:hypothetical protein